MVKSFGQKGKLTLKNRKYVSTNGLVQLEDALCVVGDGWIEVVVKI